MTSVQPPAYREDLILLIDLLRSELAWRCGVQDEPPGGLDFVELTEDEFRSVMGVAEIAIEALNQIAYPGAYDSGSGLGSADVQALLIMIEKCRAVKVPGRG